jgi:hypothetical protein
MKLYELNKILPETELCKIGKTHQTDKPGNGYTRVYYEIMKEFREEPVNIFEIGIYFGASIKMWHDFFPNGQIFGIDNGRLTPGSTVIPGGYKGTGLPFLSTDDVNLLQQEALVESVKFDWLENERIKAFKADQRSSSQLKQAFEYFNCSIFDIILDDGQHFQEHQQKSVGIMFPNIKSGKYYIIEDVVQYETLIEGTGIFWGQRKKDATDSTDYIFSTFIKTGNLKSPYITEEQAKYITDNIDDIFLYDNENKNNSPINGSSKLLVIKKK